MTDWQVLFYPDKDGYEPVKEYILGLDYSTRHEIIHVLELLYTNDVHLGQPFVEKVNKTNLRTLRIKHSSDYYRIFFFAFSGKRFILLHIIKKKADRLHRIDIDLATERMNDYKDRFST